MRLKLVTVVSAFLLGLGLLVARPAHAQMMDGSMMGQASETDTISESHSEDLVVVLDEVLQAHGWDQVDQVSCSLVTDDELASY